MNNQYLLKTKQHYKVLDGLRGIAALIVVIFHFMEIAIVDYNKNFIAHGYLAVDFFFCLSGFVLAYAYDNRAQEITFLQFIKLRLIRLQPLVIVGSLLGLLTFLVDPFSDLYTVYGFVKTAVIFSCSVFLIPYPVMEERYFNLFSLNAPSWSLFWEYVANILYISVLYKISINSLRVFVVLGAIVLCYVAYQHKNLSGGWGGPNFWDGGARILYSFLAGMLVYRANWIIKNKLGFMGIGLLLMVAFFTPYRDSYNWIIEPVLVLFYFPLIVSLGAGTVLADKFERLVVLSGEISYPLYMVHYPFVWVFLTYVAVIKPSVATLAMVIPLSVVFLLLLSYLVMREIDVPLRKYLRRNLLKN
jgi:peptidoglycan/LPS O-acetylase OafA/YrhL